MVDLWWNPSAGDTRHIKKIIDTALKGLNMGFLDRILGTVVSTEMASVVVSLIHQYGGVQGIVAQMESQGLGNIIKSWVGTGADQPMSADQVRAAFGRETIEGLSAKVGLNPHDFAERLGQALPLAVNKLKEVVPLF